MRDARRGGDGAFLSLIAPVSQLLRSAPIMIDSPKWEVIEKGLGAAFRVKASRQLYFDERGRGSLYSSCEVATSLWRGSEVVMAF